MSLTIISLSTVAATTLALIAGWSLVMDLFLRERLQMRKRLTEKFQPGGEEASTKSALFKDLKFLHDQATRADANLWQKFQNVISQSGVPLTPERLLAASAIAASTAALLAGIAMRSWIPGIPAAVCGAAAPFAYVLWKRKARVQKLRQQLPDAFELMSRAVRAGQTMASAMRMVTDKGKGPLCDEFSFCCHQESLGLPMGVAMQEMARRTGVVELQFFVVAMLVQRQAGGNPVEILNNLSGMIRKRIRLQARVKALTGEGRMQAIVLSVLPVVAFVALYILNRGYAEVLLSRPWLLGGIVASEIVGTLWIRKIVNFDF